jgi:7-cyano-7-deazaguanine synthase
MKIIHLLSGGLDSTINLGLFSRYKDFDIECLSFDYGQRHLKELDAAKKIAQSYNLRHKIIEAKHFEGCALVGDKDLENGINDTPVVPNRNMVFLSIAAAYAVQRNSKFVSWSVVKDDADVFKDCRSEFLKNINNTLRHTTGVTILAPFITKTKRQIVKEAKHHAIDFSLSWSCYQGGEQPCGKCGACILRDEAIKENFSI